MKTDKGGVFLKALFIMVVILIALIFLYGLLKGVKTGTSGVSLLNTGISAYGPTTGKNPLLPIEGGTYGTATQVPGGQATIPGASAKEGELSISSGTASRSKEPSQEYITIENRSDANINITGMYVRNGKGLRPISNQYNSWFYATADAVKIGKGVKFLSPEGTFVESDIILAPGEEANIVTGGQGSFPYRLPAAFETNACVGYLLETNKYSFAPKFKKECPYIGEDPYVSSMTVECRDYIRSMSRCEIPEKTDKSDFDALSSVCREFIRARSSYVNCVEENSGKTGFYTGMWYVFLNRPLELWAEDYETIMLLDTSGRLIDTYDY